MHCTSITPSCNSSKPISLISNLADHVGHHDGIAVLAGLINRCPYAGDIFTFKTALQGT
jgi:hypothetical protein